MKHIFLLFILGTLTINSVFSQSDRVVLNNEITLTSLKNNNTISNIETWKPTTSDLENIQGLMNQCMNTYNKQTLESFKSRGERKHAKMYQIMNMNKYKVQIVPFVNTRGEKEVWINGFCNAFGTDWQTEIVQVFDGGNCYFTMRINLTTGECIEAGTNGYA